MCVALDEQLAPARIGVLLGLALALALALALELELALVDGAAELLLDELGLAPLLQAASSVIAAAPASAVMASRLILSLSDLLFDNIWGDSFVHLLSSVCRRFGVTVSPALAAGWGQRLIAASMRVKD
jgi:hypothetical protein